MLFIKTRLAGSQAADAAHVLESPRRRRSHRAAVRRLGNGHFPRRPRQLGIITKRLGLSMTLAAQIWRKNSTFGKRRQWR
jgi:hypothetical protein